MVDKWINTNINTNLKIKYFISKFNNLLKMIYNIKNLIISKNLS